MIILILLLMPMLVLSSSISGDMPEGRPLMNSEFDGELYAKKGLWLAGGLVFNIFGVGLSYLFVPAPPPETLVGKSDLYIDIYVENYRKTVQSIHTRWAIYGCIGNTAVLSSIYLYYAIKEGCQEACSSIAQGMVDSACSGGIFF